MNTMTHRITTILGLLTLMLLAGRNLITREGTADKYFIVKDSQTLEPIADALVMRWWIYFKTQITFGVFPEKAGGSCGSESLAISNQKGELNFADSTYVPPWSFIPIEASLLKTAVHKKGMELDRLDRINGTIYLKKDLSAPRDRYIKLYNETRAGCRCSEYQTSLRNEANEIYTVPKGHVIEMQGRGCDFFTNTKK